MFEQEAVLKNYGAGARRGGMTGWMLNALMAAVLLTGIVVAAPAAETDVVSRVKTYRLAAKEGGYMDATKFVAFLEASQAPATVDPEVSDTESGSTGAFCSPC